MSAGWREPCRRGTTPSSSSVTGGADAAPEGRLEVMELLPMADGAVDPLASGVVHVSAGGAGCPFLKVVATQADSGGHIGPSLNFVRLPRHVPPNLTQAAKHVRLMARVTRHSLMLTVLPLVPGYAHRVAGPAEAGIFLHELIGTDNAEHSQPDDRHAQGRQNEDPYRRQTTAADRLAWDGVLLHRLGRSLRLAPWPRRRKSANRREREGQEQAHMYCVLIWTEQTIVNSPNAHCYERHNVVT